MSGEGLRALGRFATAADTRQLPAAVVDKARACLLYAMAVGMASLRAGQPRQAALAVAATGDGATRFFDCARCDPGVAAFANATLFHARVQDDAHPAGHVGTVVIPAALAMGEAAGANGSALLAALVAGYETALRIGRDHATDSSARGFRTTSLYGVFGAAAAGARLLGLDAPRATAALALAASMAGGLREYSEVGSEDFPFHAGTAAQNGLAAARLAATGATSAASALDGKAGFFRAYGEPGKAYVARLAAGLGEEFEMLGVTYKPYPICQFHRGVVRGCAALRERALDAELAALEIRMNPFEADFFGVRHAGPFRTFPQTFMSAPFCAALGWARGTATLAGMTCFDDPEVLRLIPLITVVSDTSCPRYGAKIRARLENGTSLDWEERQRAATYLLTWDTSLRMALELAAEVGARRDATQRLIDEVERLAAATTLQPLIAAMREACLSCDATARFNRDRA